MTLHRTNTPSRIFGGHVRPTPRILRALACALAVLTVPLSSCGTWSDGDAGETVVTPPRGNDGDGKDGGGGNGPAARTEQIAFTQAEAAQIEARYEKELAGRAKFAFDTGLADNQRLLVRKDLLALGSMRFEAPRGSYFSRAFGTADADGVLRYVAERVRVFLGSEPDARALTTGLLVGEAESDKAFLTAQNFGTLVWYESYLNRNPSVALGLNAEYPVSSMRDGLISILPGYTTLAFPTDSSGREVPVRVSGPSTLVHEARHSDCSVGLTAADVERIRETGDVLKGNTQCGHLHVKCPSGKGALAGLNACDDHLWGAYSLSYLYSLMVASSCASCSEEERAVAAMSAIDSYERVLPLPDVPQERGRLTLPALSEGGVPPPDMTHVESATW
jgi:hypothetical protein